MIVNKFTALVLSISLIKSVSGDSFSNVFVERETSPTRYYQYSAPSYSYPLARSQYSQVNTIPASVSAYVNPCVSPCVIPGQSLAAVSPSANVVTYNAPQAAVPVVVEPNENRKGYQYSYAIYESNDDRKVGSEMRDASMIRGEYSLAQPDGVREVQYVADDVNRFNTLTKNYLPNAVAEYRNSFTDGGIENSNYDNSRKKVWNDFYIKKVKDSDSEKEFRNSKVKYGKPNKQTEEKLYQKTNQNLELQNNTVNSRDSFYNKNKEKHGENLKVEFKQNYDGSMEKLKGQRKDCNEESSEESKEEKKENYKKAKNESVGSQEKQKQKSRKESKEKTSETKSEDGFGESTFVNYKNIEAHELMTPKQDVLVPYYDFVRCVQAALKNSNGNSEVKTEASSLLQYIVLKTPC